MLSIIFIITYLAILEIVLSIDNALVLAALVKDNLEDKEEQKKALFYGVWGAYIFRIIVIFIGVWLISFLAVKLIAASYLIYLSLKELFFKKEEEKDTPIAEVSKLSSIISSKFILTIISIELLDITFSLDSIATTLTVSNNKWFLIFGSIIGITAMRFASTFFIKLLEIFPILEKIAYILVLLAAFKLILSTTGIIIPENIFVICMFSIVFFSLYFYDKIFKKEEEKDK